MQRVGLLVNERTLAQAMHGRSREKLHLYDRAARRHGFQLVICTPSGLDLRRRLVRGYVYSGGRYRRIKTSLPRVVYRRIIPTQERTRQLLRQLFGLPGVIVFNPPAQRNKLLINSLLAGRRDVAASIPPTIPLRSSEQGMAFIRKYGSVYAKPAVGSVGKGIYRIRRRDSAAGREQYEIYSWTGTRHVKSAGALLRWLKSRSARNYILQRGIELARYHGRPFDVRMTVQRDGSGSWAVTGMVAKVAKTGLPVTNLGRGGRTVTLQQALSTAFPGGESKTIEERLRRLGLTVARELSRRWPLMADLGLDLAVDRQGRAWFLEANLREQRPSFSEAGGPAAVRRQYAQPMAYAAYLLRA